MSSFSVEILSCILFIVLRYVQPVYIICKNSDGSFVAPDGISNSLDDALKKLKLNLRLIQVFFEESLHEHGLDRASFRMPEDDAGDIAFKLLVSDLDIGDTMHMGPDDLYAYFHKGMVRCSVF